MPHAEEANHKFVGLLPEMLIREIQNKRCVLFVGAGLSARAKNRDGGRIPTWKGLLQKMVDWCVDHRVPLRGEAVDFLRIIDAGRLLVAAQELQQSLGSQLNRCLSEILYTDSALPSDAHRLLCKLPWVAVLTSNYDGLIEGAYAVESQGILPPVYSPEGVSQAIENLRNSRFFVFKVHGDVNIQGSIVLGNRDYSRLLYLSPAYRSFLETVFATYTVLFVGFGGADPDLDGIVDRLSTIYERGIGQHFLLIGEDQFAPIERLRLLEDKRLDCITYQPDDSHSQVEEFLKAVIARTTEEKKVPDPFKGKAKRPRAFVSGSQRDLLILHKIGKIAESVGFDVWIADKDIEVGAPILDEISKAIDQADVFIVVMSNSSINSKWVAFETERALGARKRVIPIRIDDVMLPSYLSNLLYLQLNGPDLLDDDEPRIAEILQRFLRTLRESKQ
jgi:hypothetical protein